MNHGYADVSYQATNELAEQQAAQSLMRRVSIIGLPKDLKQVSLADIALGLAFISLTQTLALSKSKSEIKVG